MNVRSIFVTGTDTGVGKTIVAASIAKNMREAGEDVLVMKPYASGIVPGNEEQSDSALLAAAAGMPFDLEKISPARFELPLAPASAARREQKSIDHAAVLAATRAATTEGRFSIIEGVGGAAVPLVARYLVSTFLRDLKIPALIVARSALGTINHSLMTIEHLHARGIPIAGIIFVRQSGGELSLAEEVGPAAVKELVLIRSFGLVPFVPGLEESCSLDQRMGNLPSDCTAIQNFCETWRDATHPG